jgi:hypothetical protein
MEKVSGGIRERRAAPMNEVMVENENLNLWRSPVNSLPSLRDS